MKQQIRNESGLTLIELCLTVLILGFIVAAASPRLSGYFYRWRIKSTADRIARDIQMIQRRTILSGRSWRLAIQENGCEYVVEQQFRRANPEQSVKDWPLEWQTEYSRKLANGIRIQTEERLLQWFPDGEFPKTSFIIKDARKNIFKIQIEKSKLTVHSHSG